MKILLLNENPVVSRLVSLSAKKMSYDFEELNAYSENLGNYDVIVVDSDTPAPLKILKEKCDRLIFLAPRNQNVEDIDAQILQKPFLPTDFLNLLNNKDANKHTSIDLPDENSLDINSEGMEDLSFDDDAQDDNSNKTLETQNLEHETIKEQTQEDTQIDLDLTLEDGESEKEDLSQEHTALDTEPSLDELDDKNDEDLEIKEDDKNEEIEKQELLDDSKTNTLEMQEELSESQDDNSNKTLETQNLEHDNLEQETIKEQTQEDTQTDLDLTLEDGESEKEDLSQEHTALDTEPSLDELDDKNDEDLEDNKELQANISDFDDLPVVEEQEKEMDFDDLPEDAEFLGQAKDNEESEEVLEEFAPVVEEDVQDEMDDFTSNLSTQDQIKEELAQLDELDYGIDSDNSSKVLEDFKDEPILDDKELGTNEEEVVVPNLNISDFDTLKESDIQEALGEEILEKNEEPIVSDVTKDDNSEEIVNELSQSIAGAITSSIKDDTLKAALKGMNMNININISFKED
ncbi:highly acidic protein [Campylobacter jejuni]